MNQVGGVNMDQEIARELQKILKSQGLEFLTSTKFTKLINNGKTIVVEAENTAAPQNKMSIECDKVLVCVGRKPNTENLIDDSVANQFFDSRGFININDNMETIWKE